MSKTLDLVIYGATGFTGEYVVRYLARTLKEGSQGGGGAAVRWGIAGRSQDKLKRLVGELQSHDLPTPATVMIADINDARSLDAMASATKLVLNCTGPYRFLGEPVVAACLRGRADVIDLCGEPEFMDRCFLKYNKKAAEKKVLVISACAFDSVPADLGVCFITSLFPKPYSVVSVESFLTIDTGGHGMHGHVTTFEAAVHGFGSQRELARLRREIKRQFPYDDRRLGGGLVSKSGPYFEPRVGRYCFRFPGSDASVVRSSQRQMVLQGLAPSTSLPRYATYFTVPSAFWAGVMAMVGSAFQTLAKYGWGRKLLLRFPGVFTLGAFSAEGPTQAELDAASFSMTFFARGIIPGKDEASSSGGEQQQAVASSSPQQPPATTTQPLLPVVVVPPSSTTTSGSDSSGKVIKTRVSGPEPGYVATPIIFVELARCLLDERPTLPVQGGVFTPGAVFFRSSLIDRLKMAGIEFTVLEA